MTLWNDLKKTEKELIKAAPEDEEEIRKFIQYVEYSKQCLFPAGKPMEMWKIKDYISMGKNMMDFPKVMKEFGKISLLDYSRRFKSPLLQKMICDYLRQWLTETVISRWGPRFRCHSAWKSVSKNSAAASSTIAASQR